MWCMPKYSNPTGEIYSPETVQRLASMRTGAPDFRLFWDNAYTVHHLTERRHEVANILDLCEKAGNPDRAFVFASTSKVTFAGAGLAFFASSAANVKWYLARATKRTIGPDKLNQLRHVRFLKNEDGLLRHMDAHRALIAPKFDAADRRPGIAFSWNRRGHLVEAGGRLLHQRGCGGRHGATGRGTRQKRGRGVDSRRGHVAARSRSLRPHAPSRAHVPLFG